MRVNLIYQFQKLKRTTSYSNGKMEDVPVVDRILQNMGHGIIDDMKRKW